MRHYHALAYTQMSDPTAISHTDMQESDVKEASADTGTKLSPIRKQDTTGPKPATPTLDPPLLPLHLAPDIESFSLKDSIRNTCGVKMVAVCVTSCRNMYGYPHMYLYMYPYMCVTSCRNKDVVCCIMNVQTSARTGLSLTLSLSLSLISLARTLSLWL